jgi:LacI family transcriptional regulator, repressor for deo operon, udp, cdd, tsx, nupC, and nupG
MSIKKVAEIANVSIATVSRFFSKPNLLKQATYERVKNAVDAINYKPNTLAQNFRRGKSGLIIVVVYRIGNPIYENFTHAITATAQSKGYDVLIKESSEAPVTVKYYQDMLNSKQADGLIVMTDVPQTNQKTQEILQQLPIVFIEGVNQKDLPSTQYVGLANYQAALSATKHLISLGHQYIACISPEAINTAYMQRIKGYSDAIKQANLKTEKILYACQHPCNLPVLLEQIFSTHPATTAIFCIDDDIAIDILPLCKAAGHQVPHHISIMGFNNIRYSSKTSPPLCTVELPLPDIAFHAIQLLCNKIDPTYEPGVTQLDSALTTNSSSSLSYPPFQLILRASTTKAPS